MREQMNEQERWEHVVEYAKGLLDYDSPVGMDDEFNELDNPDDDDRAPLAVMSYRVKRAQLEVGGPTTFIEFWFDDSDGSGACNEDTVMSASLFTNRFGSGKDMQEFPYLDDEVKALYNKYSLYLYD